MERMEEPIGKFKPNREWQGRNLMRGEIYSKGKSQKSNST
jgi:hypothetical protein